jgi:hypothetical protein
LKYRLTRNDGVEIDVPGIVWESVLALGYRNGWRPSGTEAPRAVSRSAPRAATFGDPPKLGGARWVSSDYFSACCQYVRTADARELGAAAMRGRHEQEAGCDPAAAKHDAGIRKVARFAQDGGFVIGRAPK